MRCSFRVLSRAKPRRRKILGVGVKKRWAVVAWMPGTFHRYSTINLPTHGLAWNDTFRGKPRLWNYATSNESYILDIFNTHLGFWDITKNLTRKRLPPAEPWDGDAHTRRGARKLLRQLKALNDPRLVDLHIVDIYEFINAYRKY